jgi:hypothetical protein
VIAVIDSNGNGLCNDVAFNMTNVHPTLVLQSQTMSVAMANAVKSDVTYAYSNSASYNKQIYCGSLSGIDNSPEANPAITAIYPNPAADNCILTLEASKITDHSFISIYDISGQMVCKFQLSANNSSKEISTREFPEGLYLIQISSEQGIIGKGKLLVIR